MGIRPVDMQGVIAQSVQSAPISRQAEDAAARGQTAAQAQFANKVEERNETIAETQNLGGNKVTPKEERDRQDAQKRKKKRQPGDPFEEVVDGPIFGSEDDAVVPRLIDFTA